MSESENPAAPRRTADIKLPWKPRRVQGTYTAVDPDGYEVGVFRTAEEVQGFCDEKNALLTDGPLHASAPPPSDDPDPDALEIMALDQCVRALRRLPPEALPRVLAYLGDRFAPVEGWAKVWTKVSSTVGPAIAMTRPTPPGEGSK